MGNDTTTMTANWRRAEDAAKICCQRMRAARIYNGYTIEEASERIGYGGNKTQLSLIENGERAPPMWVILRAATVYSVPTDYLLGFVDEAEASQNDCRQAALLRYMEAQMTAYNNTVRHMIARFIVEGAPALWMVRDMVALMAEHNEAWSRFKALNPEAEDMRGGGKLQSTLDALTAISKTAGHALQRHDNLIERAAQLAENTHPEQARLQFAN